MDKTKFPFTQQKLEELKCPNSETKQVRVSDTKVRGLQLRVTPNGSKQFIYRRRLPLDNESPGKICEISLGKFGDVKIERVRQKAEEFNTLVGDKKDPSLGFRGELTYGQLFEQYIEQYAKLHTSTWEDAEYNHKKYFERFHDRPVSKIKRSDVDHWMKDLSDRGTYTANRNCNQLRAVFNWGLKRALIACENPAVGATFFKAQARERFLHPGTEFEAFAQALNNEPKELFRDFFWMCLFTGARKTNVLKMRWDEIDLELLSWRIPITKNGDSQNVPLTPNAAAILRRREKTKDPDVPWVFPADRANGTGERTHLIDPKTAWKRILKEAKIKDLRIHDLRRTAGSYMAIQGVSPTIIGKALGHRSINSTAIYTRLTQDPVRQALENAQEALADPKKLFKQKAPVVKIDTTRKRPTKKR